jgi:diadenosine tetraphosphatase ApaH/serine/threonine PP2A family protein phosphatase
MRILLLSDVHANLEALEACLAAAPSCDKVVNLGDVVGYGGSPNEVTDHARKLPGVMVRGNHDRACTGQVDLQSFNPVAGMAALWTMRTLSAVNLAWLKSLPQGPLTLLTDDVAHAASSDFGAVQVVHGSPLDEDDYIIVLRDAQEPLERTPARLTFFGHTHLQGGFAQEGERWETLRPTYRSADKTDIFELPLRHDAKYLINPGSVGQPRDGDRRAAFAVFEPDKYAVTFHRVPYDIRKAQEHIFAAKLPERLATRLAEGR